MADSICVGDKVRIVRDRKPWNGMEGVVDRIEPTFDGKDITVRFRVTHNANDNSVEIGSNFRTFLSMVDVVGPVFSQDVRQQDDLVETQEGIAFQQETANLIEGVKILEGLNKKSDAMRLRQYLVKRMGLTEYAKLG